MSIWIAGWSEVDETPQCGWPSLNLLWTKADFYSLKVELHALLLRLSSSRLKSILSTPWLSGLGTTSLALLGPQLADCRSWDFPAPQLCEPVPHNKTLYIHTQIHTLTKTIHTHIYTYPYTHIQTHRDTGIPCYIKFHFITLHRSCLFHSHLSKTLQ